MENFSTESRKRIQFAEHLVKKITVKKQLAAIFIGGSTCRNLADEYADLELCFVWKKTPQQYNLNQISKELQLEIYGSNYEQTELGSCQIEMYSKTGNLSVDVFHITPAYITQKIEETLVQKKVSEQNLSFLNVIANCLVLMGEEVLQIYKQQIGQLPDELAQLIIERKIQQFFKVDVALCIKRKEWTLVYSALAGYQKLIFRILIALNRVYFSTLKHMDKQLTQLTIKPPNIIYTYNQFYQQPPEKIWKMLKHIKMSILQLVKQEFPTIAILPIQKRVNKTRNKWLVD